MEDVRIDLAREERDERDESVALVGRLDGRTAAAARAVLHDLVDAGDGRLVVDLIDLEIWDRAGLGVIVGLARRASGRGRPLVLTNAGQREQRLLLVAGVGRMARVTAGVPQQNRAQNRAETLLGA